MNRYRRSAAQKTGVEPTVLNTDDSIYFVSSNEGSPKKPNIISRKSSVLKRLPIATANSPRFSLLQSKQGQMLVLQQQCKHLQSSSQLETPIQPTHHQLMLPSRTPDHMAVVQHNQFSKSYGYYLLDDGTLTVVDNSSLLPPIDDESTGVLVHETQLGGQQLLSGKVLQFNQPQQQHWLVVPEIQEQQKVLALQPQQHPVQVNHLPVGVQQQAPLQLQRVLVKSKPQQNQHHEFQLKQELERQQKQRQLEEVVKLKIESEEHERLQQQQLREQSVLEECQRINQVHMGATRVLEDQQQLREEQTEENQRQMQMRIELQEHRTELCNKPVVELAIPMQLDDVFAKVTHDGQQEIRLQQQQFFEQDKLVTPDLDTRASELVLESEKVDEEEVIDAAHVLLEPEEECQQDQYVILQIGNKTLLLPVAAFQEYCEAQQSNDVEKVAHFVAMVEQALGEANEISDSSVDNPETDCTLQDNNTSISDDFNSVQGGSTIRYTGALPDLSSQLQLMSSVVSIKPVSKEYQINNGQQDIDCAPCADFDSTPIFENKANSLFLKIEGDTESSSVLLSVVGNNQKTQVINSGHTEEREYDYELQPAKRLKEDEVEVSVMTKSKNSPVVAQIKSQTEASTNTDNIKIFRCGTCTKEFLAQDQCMQHIFDVHEADPLNTLCEFRRTTETRFMCHTCSRTFGSLADFQHHNLKTHLSDNNRGTDSNSGENDETDLETAEHRVSTPSSVAPPSPQSPPEAAASNTVVPELHLSGLPPAALIDPSTNLKSDPVCSPISKNTEILAYPSSLDCSKCCKTLANLYYFLLHGLVHMSKSNVDNNHWLCQICRQTFSSKPELTSHFLIHYQMSLGTSSHSDSSTQGNVIEHGSQLLNDAQSSPRHSPIASSIKTEQSTEASSTPSVDQHTFGIVRSHLENGGQDIPILKMKLQSSQSTKPPQTERRGGNSELSGDDVVVQTGITIVSSSIISMKAENENQTVGTSQERDVNSCELVGAEVQLSYHSVPLEAIAVSEEPSKRSQMTVSNENGVADENLKIKSVDVTEPSAANEVAVISLEFGNGADVITRSQSLKRSVNGALIEPFYTGELKREGLSLSHNNLSVVTSFVNNRSTMENETVPLNDHKGVQIDSEVKIASVKVASEIQKSVVVKRERKTKLEKMCPRRTRLSIRKGLNETDKASVTNGLENSVVVAKSASEVPSCSSTRTIRVMEAKQGSKTNISVISQGDLVDNSPDTTGRFSDKNMVNIVVESVKSESEVDKNLVIKRRPGRPKKLRAEAGLKNIKIVDGRISRGNSSKHPGSERKSRFNKFNRNWKQELKLVNGSQTPGASKALDNPKVLDSNPLSNDKVFGTRSNRNNEKVDSLDKKLCTGNDLPPTAKPIKMSKAVQESKLVHVCVAATVASEKSTEKKTKRGRKTKTMSRNFAGDQPEFEGILSKVLRNGTSSSSTLTRRKDRGFLKGTQLDDFTNPLSRTAVHKTFVNIYMKIKESTN